MKWLQGEEHRECNPGPGARGADSCAQQLPLSKKEPPCVGGGCTTGTGGPSLLNKRETSTCARARPAADAGWRGRVLFSQTVDMLARAIQAQSQQVTDLMW